MNLHIMVMEKFIPPFIRFVEQNFPGNNDIYLVLGDTSLLDFVPRNRVVQFRLRDMAIYVLLGYRADRILLHGLWSNSILLYLTVQPWLVRKSYWFMWGGDFYFPRKQSRLKRALIARLPFLVTYLKGDIEYVRNHYGAVGEHIPCFLYPSNLFQTESLPTTSGAGLNILVGNSGDPTNEHVTLFRKLAKLDLTNTKIFSIFAYGDMEYSEVCIEEGRALLGEHFVPLRNFVPIEEYRQFLATIDIAIYGHRRQQGMGNIIALLGMGKMVYLRSDISTWDLFSELGIVVGDVDKLKLTRLDRKSSERNRAIVASTFSSQEYKRQLENVLLH